MPSHTVYFIALSFLAALGGLLHLLLRRHRAEFFLPVPSSHPPQSLSSPLQTPDGAGASPARSRPSSNTPFTPRAQGELILVVDDEESVRDLLNTVLLNHGYQVALARDGVEGLRIFSAQPDQVALVLTDVHMPNRSGQSFADLLRPIRPDVRILFMSGMDSSEISSSADSARFADPFLLKPFKPAVLLEKIHKLLHPDPPQKA